MQTPPTPSSVVDGLLAKWHDLPPDGRDLFEADVIARYPALAAEFAACLHELRATEAEERGKAPEKPGDIIGKYKLLEELGEGGFGIVFKAEETGDLRRKVALKVLKPGIDTKQILARFEAERQALALMDHPNIAKVFGAGTTDKGRPYFVMELVQGDPITDYCDKHKLSTEERLKLFNSVCQAIQHAHTKAVIHRDIKPSNILVAVHDNEHVAKVIDFGIAKAIGARLTDRTVVTVRGFFIGTLEYMSPEQAEMSGVDIDTRSDVYSLGVLLYELLSGGLPFDRETLRKAAWDEVCRMVREVDPPKPSTRLTKATAEMQTETARRRKCSPANLSIVLRGELDWVVMRALEKDRTRRYATADALAEDVRRYLTGEAVEARPPSALYRFRKWARRERLIFAVSTAVLVSLIVGLAVATAFYLEKRAALDQAYRLLYASDIRLAQRAWDDSQVELARELLERHNDHPGRPDLRGFEWFYLHRVFHTELLILDRPNMMTCSLAFSPDGRRLVLGDIDALRVLDATSGQGQITIKTPEPFVHSVAFSHNGRLLASGHMRNATVWDATSGQAMFTLVGHTNSVLDVAFSPDGRRLASGGADSTVRVWDATSGRQLVALNGHTGLVYSVAFSPDGRLLASGGEDRTVKVWDATSGQEVYAIKGQTRVAFSPDGRLLASGGPNSTLSVWRAPGEQEMVTLEGHTNRDRMMVSADGRLLASRGAGDTVKVWDVTSGQEIITVKGHERTVTAIALSPDGRKLASGTDIGGGVRIWDVTRRQEAFTLKEHTNRVSSLTFSFNAEQLATASDDGTVRVWDVTKKQIVFALKGHTNSVSSVAFSPDGRLLASGDGDGSVRVWDATSGQAVFTLKSHPVLSVAFSPDGRRLVAGSKDGTEQVWDTKSGQIIVNLIWHTNRNLSSVAFSLDGRWQVHEKDFLGFLEVQEAPSKGAAFARKAYAGSAGSVTFSPDGRRLAYVKTGLIKRDGTSVRVVSTIGPGPELELNGHSDSVNSVTFSPDGRRLVSGSKDGTVRVWDATSGQELLMLKGQTKTVSQVAFSPDGRRLGSGSDDGTVQVWDATPQAVPSTVSVK